MSDVSSATTPWRYSRAGAVLLSYDFYVGVPLGLATATLVGLSQGAENNAAGLLIGAAAVSAAIATLVLTSLTVLLTALSADYRAYLRQAPGGVRGITEPFRLIIAVAAVGSLASVIGSFTIGFVDDWAFRGFGLGAALSSAPGLACVAWALLGCIQLTEQFVSHWANNDKAMELAERRRRAMSRNAG